MGYGMSSRGDLTADPRWVADEWYYRAGSDVVAVGRGPVVTAGRYVWLRFEAGRLVAVGE